MTIACLNVDNSSTIPHREPIQTFWWGNYDINDPHLVKITAIDLDTGETIGTLEPGGLAAQGYHDNWFGDNVDIDRNLRVEVWIDGVLEDWDERDCSIPETTTTTTTEAPVVTTTTRPPELPVTGASLMLIAVIGGAILAAGTIIVNAKQQEDDVS